MSHASSFKAHTAVSYKSSAIQYALGRSINAVFGLGIFLALAKSLSTEQYAAYVVVVATLEILLMAGNLGLDWVTAIEVPRLQAHNAWHRLRRFTAQCLGLQALSLGVLAAGLAVGAELWARLLNHADVAPVLLSYSAVLWLEGLSRAVRDQLLSSLLMQWASQLAQFLRNLALALILWVQHLHSTELNALQVAQAEIAASALSLVVGLLLLGRRLQRECALPSANANADQTPWPALRKTAWHAWVASLTTLLWSGQVAVLLVARLLGAEAAGVAGFARNLAEQLRKLMPLEFLFHQVRTFLVQSFAAEGSQERLYQRTALCFKLNLLFVLPLATCIALYGDEVCALVSSGRFAHAHWALVGWALWVLVWSHHRLTDSVAHLLHRSASIGRTSSVLAAMPLAYAVGLQEGGLPALYLCLIVAELSYNILVLRQVLQGTHPYPWTQLALPKLAASVAGGASAGLLLSQAWPHAPLALRLGAVLAVYGACVALLRPVQRHERGLLPGQGPTHQKPGHHPQPQP